MKRLLIICEGYTEEEFFSKTMYHHFFSKGIFVQPINTRGIKPWEAIKQKTILKLKENKDVFVTTFFDFYGIKPSHKFPKWDDSKRINDVNQKLDFLETEMLNTIPDEFKNRFIPYIQLHEFEGLLFNQIENFYEVFTNEIIGLEELKNTLKNYPNPEMINDSVETAPSKRLQRIIKGYDKIVYGNILFEAIGLTNVRNKAPRFNNWLSILEKL